MFTTGQKRNKLIKFTPKLLWAVLAVTCCSGLEAYAASTVSYTKSAIQQKIRVQGRVLDESTGLLLEGVSIRMGSVAIAQTSSNGSVDFEIEPGATVNFMLIGYSPIPRTFTTSTTEVIITLQHESQDIEEVVVTALGIEREAKGLGYAVTTVSGDDLTNAASSNWSDGLKGKVAGLNLTQASSGPINSTRINLRGDRSLSGNNEALIVIDGIPMVNGQLSSGVGDAYGVGGADVPIDFGNGLSDINPDDIESVTVLKGAAATA